MVGIYMFKNIVRNLVYIGQSTDIEKRKKQHIALLRKGNHTNAMWQDDWNIYGEDAFEFTILKKCISYDLNYYEKLYIEEYRATDSFYGYNLSKGIGIDMRSQMRHYDGKSFSERYYDSHDNKFFLDENRKKRYATLCLACEKDCKQSFRAEILSCPLFSEMQ